MKAPSDPAPLTRSAADPLGGAPEPVRNTVARFLIADLCVVVLVIGGLSLASQRAGVTEGILDVTDRTSIVAASLPELRLSADGRVLDPASRAAVGQLVAVGRAAGGCGVSFHAGFHNVAMPRSTPRSTRVPAPLPTPHPTTLPTTMG